MEKALAVLEQWNPKSRTLAELCINRGNLSLTENPALARTYYEKARVLMEEQSPPSYGQRTLYINVSISYAKEGRPAKALKNNNQTNNKKTHTNPQNTQKTNTLSHR